MIEFRSELRGYPGLLNAFDQLAESIQDYSPAWPSIRRVFREIMVGQFTSQGSRGGRKWANLSKGYKRWKERVAPGRPILFLTGRLASSLISETADSINESDSLSLSMGTRVHYAKYHQAGTTSFSYAGVSYSTRLPARPIINLKKNDYELMASYMVDLSGGYGVASGFKWKGRERASKRLLRTQTRFETTRASIARRGISSRRG